MDDQKSSKNLFFQSQKQCERNLHCLENEVENIKKLQNRIKEIPTSSLDFENWLKRAEHTTQSFDLLNEKMCKLTRSWCRCIGWLQYKYIGKKAENLANSVAGISKDGKLLLDGLPEAKVEEEKWVKEIEKALELRKETCDEIMKELTDENETKMIIGVYGMAGIGKTILVCQLAKKVREEHSFKVVMETGTPSSNPSLSKEQREKIDHWLKMGKKVLVLLDNIWKPITSLEDIGIPDPFDEEHRGCLAVVITSRNQDVLSKMDTRKNFLLEPLPEDKTVDLLRHVGIDDDNESHIQILRECGGLPLALVEVASRIDQIIKTSISPDPVYLSLNRSFLYLENDELRHTFLLCSLFGNSEISYEQILKYVVGGRGPHVPVNLKMDDERRRVHKNMDSLKKSSLLQDGKTSQQSAVMHPIIFQFAKTVASRNRMFVSSDINEKYGSKQLLHQLHKDEQRNLTHISVLGDAIDEPRFGDFRKLMFLYVGDNCRGKSSIMAMNFEELRVLDHVGKPIFGPTIYGLKHIQTLCLKDSGELRIEEMIKIANLKSLKILSFTGDTTIHQFPNEMGNLTGLCMLELRCRLAQMIPPNVLLKLNQIQELYIKIFLHWADFETNLYIILSEVDCLQHLSALDIDLSSSSLRYLELTSN